MRNRIGVVAWMTCVVLVAISTSAAAAQSPESRPTTGSIAGIVTRDGKPAAGVGVLLVERNARGWGAGDTVERTRSDKEGKFVFEGIGRGSYGIDAFLPGAFIQDSTPWDGPVLITVSDGENVTGVKLNLERGGVITGKVVDDEGRPVVGEQVHVYVEKSAAGDAPSMSDVDSGEMTDDRGIYRIFGLSPGTYAVGAGELKDGHSFRFGAKVTYELAFHGGSSTPESAKRIPVETATEATDVDIVVRRGSSGFTITGKVVDAETRKPVTNVWLGRGPMVDGKLQGYMGGGGVRDDGSFSMEGVAPGAYGIIASATQEESASYFCEPVEVNVTDRDVKDLVVEMRRGATISGVIVPLETDRSVDLSSVKNSALIFQPVLEAGDVVSTANFSFGQVRIQPDFTFAARGMRLGAYRPVFSQWSPVKGFYVARLEVDGTPLSGPIRISEIKEVKNVRIVVGRTTSVLRGRVVLRNGTLPFERVNVSLRPPGSPLAVSWMQVDASGAFLLESAPPGDYVAIAASRVDKGKPIESKPVAVTIGREGTVEVTIELDLSPKPPSGGGDQ